MQRKCPRFEDEDFSGIVTILPAAQKVKTTVNAPVLHQHR